MLPVNASSAWPAVTMWSGQGSRPSLRFIHASVYFRTSNNHLPQDVPNLVAMLTYTMGGPSIDAGVPCGDPRIIRYTPPVPEFEVMVITVEAGESLALPRLQVRYLLFDERCLPGRRTMSPTFRSQPSSS